MGDKQQQQATHHAFAAPVVLKGMPIPICAPIYCAQAGVCECEGQQQQQQALWLPSYGSSLGTARKLLNRTTYLHVTIHLGPSALHLGTHSTAESGSTEPLSAAVVSREKIVWKQDKSYAKGWSYICALPLFVTVGATVIKVFSRQLQSKYGLGMLCPEQCAHSRHTPPTASLQLHSQAVLSALSGPQTEL